MKIVCLDADTLGNDVDLDAVFGKFGEFVSYNMTEANQTVQRLQNADIVLTNKVLITKDVIAQTNLKLICVTATGVNNIDLEAAKEANIPVKNVAGYSTNSVAQQTFANILALRKKNQPQLLRYAIVKDRVKTMFAVLVGMFTEIRFT